MSEMDDSPSHSVPPLIKKSILLPVYIGEFNVSAQTLSSKHENCELGWDYTT